LRAAFAFAFTVATRGAGEAADAETGATLATVAEAVAGALTVAALAATAGADWVDRLAGGWDRRVVAAKRQVKTNRDRDVHRTVLFTGTPYWLDEANRDWNGRRTRRSLRALD
jgi:hypothetical protein